MIPDSVAQIQKPVRVVGGGGGLRPLKRFIQKNVETLAARAILKGEIMDGDTILVDLLKDADGTELTVNKK